MKRLILAALITLALAATAQAEKCNFEGYPPPEATCVNPSDPVPAPEFDGPPKLVRVICRGVRQEPPSMLRKILTAGFAGLVWTEFEDIRMVPENSLYITNAVASAKKPAEFYQLPPGLNAISGAATCQYESRGVLEFAMVGTDAVVTGTTRSKPE